MARNGDDVGVPNITHRHVLVVGCTKCNSSDGRAAIMHQVWAMMKSYDTSGDIVGWNNTIHFPSWDTGLQHPTLYVLHFTLVFMPHHDNKPPFGSPVKEAWLCSFGLNLAAILCG